MNASVKVNPTDAVQRLREAVKQFCSGLPGTSKQQAIAASAVIILLAGLALAIAWNSNSLDGDLRPLYGRQEMYEVASVIEALDNGSIPYQLHPVSGQILVSSDELPMARMHLATAGIKPGISAGMELLTTGNQLGRSQFVERKQYLQALQGELEQTISSLRPVRTARVHLAVAERTAFLRNQIEPTAAVYLDLYSGGSLDAKQVQGIVNLLAGSLPELKPEHVSVLDQNSNPLTGMETGPDESDRKLQYRHNIEQQYVQRLSYLLEPLVGAQNLRVAVNADIDFSYQESSREGYEPGGAVVRSESISGNIDKQGAATGVPGASSNVDALADENADGQSPESTISTVRNYEVDKTLSYQRLDAFRLTRISASVVLNDRILTSDDNSTDNNAEATLLAVDELVRNAVGINLERGDQVSVRALPFFDRNEPGQPRSGVAAVLNEGGSMNPILIALAAGLLLVIGGAVYMVRKRSKQQREKEAMEAELALLEAGDSKGEQNEIYGRVSADSSDRIRDLSVSSPDQIATVLERWIKEVD